MIRLTFAQHRPRALPSYSGRSHETRQSGPGPANCGTPSRWQLQQPLSAATPSARGRPGCCEASPGRAAQHEGALVLTCLQSALSIAATINSPMQDRPYHTCHMKAFRTWSNLENTQPVNAGSSIKAALQETGHTPGCGVWPSCHWRTPCWCAGSWRSSRGSAQRLQARGQATIW